MIAIQLADESCLVYQVSFTWCCIRWCTGAVRDMDYRGILILEAIFKLVE